MSKADVIMTCSLLKQIYLTLFTLFHDDSVQVVRELRTPLRQTVMSPPNTPNNKDSLLDKNHGVIRKVPVRTAPGLYGNKTPDIHVLRKSSLHHCFISSIVVSIGEFLHTSGKLGR